MLILAYLYLTLTTKYVVKIQAKTFALDLIFLFSQ